MYRRQVARKSFRQTTTGNVVTAIENLDFSIGAGEIVAVVGQTGCGKSTFLDILIGLETPTDGELLIDNRAPYSEFDSFRGEIATIFQQDRLLPWRSALQNVCLPLELLHISKDEQVQRATYWLSRLGLEKFSNAYPHELSGGMRQRVAIARAFVLQAGLLLADESFGHLDEVTAGALRRTFVELTRATQLGTARGHSGDAPGEPSRRTPCCSTAALSADATLSAGVISVQCQPAFMLGRRAKHRPFVWSYSERFRVRGRVTRDVFGRRGIARAIARTGRHRGAPTSEGLLPATSCRLSVAD